jgi:hypothetical protein
MIAAGGGISVSSGPDTVAAIVQQLRLLCTQPSALRQLSAQAEMAYANMQVCALADKAKFMRLFEAR